MIGERSASSKGIQLAFFFLVAEESPLIVGMVLSFCALVFFSKCLIQTCHHQHHATQYLLITTFAVFAELISDTRQMSGLRCGSYVTRASYLYEGEGGDVIILNSDKSASMLSVHVRQSLSMHYGWYSVAKDFLVLLFMFVPRDNNL